MCFVFTDDCFSIVYLRPRLLECILVEVESKRELLMVAELHILTLSQNFLDPVHTNPFLLENRYV